MNLAEMLRRTSHAWGERPAIAVGRSVRLSYAGLAARAAALASGLKNRHRLNPGDRVALVMRNDADYMSLVFACWWAGLSAVPINAKLHPKEIAYILGDSGARVALATEDLAAGLADAASEVGTGIAEIVIGTQDFDRLGSADPAPMAEVDADALAWLFYTSGTTGRPKGAMLTHRNILTMTLCYFADVDTIRPGDAILHAAPMSHASGLYGMPHIAVAARHVIPDSGGFDVAEIVDLLSWHKNVAMFAAPTMVTRFIDSPALKGANLENLKTIIYGGGPMYLADFKRARERLGPRLAQIYGQGESPMTITALPKSIIADDRHPRWEERMASVGIRQSAVEVVVADGDDRPLPTGEIGEVVVRGPSVMAGYWNKPEATAAALRGGWLHTGDVGAFDADGFLTLKDRSKDMVISGGSNIYPREIEEVLLRHPGVSEVAVVGAPDADWGEVVVAFVVRRPGATVTETDLDRACLDAIARFKRPKRYRFVAELPKNNYGKILKTELRKTLATAVESVKPPA
jgi:long-chain acyl-CoA synthetase